MKLITKIIPTTICPISCQTSTIRWQKQRQKLLSTSYLEVRIHMCLALMKNFKKKHCYFVKPQNSTMKDLLRMMSQSSAYLLSISIIKEELRLNIVFLIIKLFQLLNPCQFIMLCRIPPTTNMKIIIFSISKPSTKEKRGCFLVFLILSK